MSYRFLTDAPKDIFDNTIPRFVNKEDFTAKLHQENPTAKPPAPTPNPLASLWYSYTENTKRLMNEADAAAPVPPPTLTPAETLLSGWEHTFPPSMNIPTPSPLGFEPAPTQTTLTSFGFRPSRGNISTASSRTRTQSPSKSTAVGPPSPDTPRPDKMELTGTTGESLASPPILPDIQVLQLLDLITALRKDLSDTQAQVRLLTTSIQALSKNAPEPTPQKPGPKAPTPKAPPKPTFAAVASSGPAPPPQQHIKSDYTKTARELIFELSTRIPPLVSDYVFITLANTVVRSTTVKFCQARRTVRGNIILLTRPNTSAVAAEAYTTAIASAFAEQGLITSTIHANAHGSKFLLHVVTFTSHAKPFFF
ncbi:hypothetical protein Q9L58_010200 [Maublancomyces gigas]|uniref:Uncharacterized protein n=1 Tax=Discina gigas TaxID=1032678 RepID=A0ABR3G4T8_9PEZI